MATQQLPPTPLRLPPDLKAWLKEQAMVNRRSLNGELLHRIEQSRAAQTDDQVVQGVAQ